MKELGDLMKLQGEVKIHLIRRGIAEAVAHALAAEVLHSFTESEAMNKNHRDAYQRMTASRPA